MSLQLNSVFIVVVVVVVTLETVQKAVWQIFLAFALLSFGSGYITYIVSNADSFLITQRCFLVMGAFLFYTERINYIRRIWCKNKITATILLQDTNLSILDVNFFNIRCSLARNLITDIALENKSEHI